MKGTFRNGSRRLHILLAVFLWLGCLFCPTAWAVPKAVVAHSAGGISFVDLATSPPTVSDILLKTLFAKGKVLDVVVTQDKKYVFVSEYEASKLHRIDITKPDDLQVKSLPVGMKPEDIALSPDGRLAIVTDGKSDQPVVFIDVENFDSIKSSYTLKTDGARAQAVAIAPDNQTVLFADYSRNRILAGTINADRTGLATEMPYSYGFAGPRNIAISPDGQTVLVVGDGGIITFKITAPGVLSSAATTVTDAPGNGQSVAFAPDGKKAYSYHKPTDATSPKMVELEVDALSGITIKDTVELQVAPSSEYGVDTIAVSPDGRYLVATDAGSDTLAIFDLTLGRLTPSYLTLYPDPALTLAPSLKPAPPADLLAGVAFIPMIPPKFTMGPQELTASVGTEFSFAFTATHALSYAMLGAGGTEVAVPGLTFDKVTGTLSGTPTTSGTIPDITITATNEDGTASLGPFTLTVSDVNHTPAISGEPAKNVYRGGRYSFIPEAADLDLDTLRFSIQGQPDWADFNEFTGELSGAPTSAKLQIYSNIVISVSDGKATSPLPAFSISILNNVPQISDSPTATATVGDSYSFQLKGTDDDSDDLTYSMSGNPDWLSLNSTGLLTGTPAATDAGTSGIITITVSDGWAESSVKFTITATLPNRPPTIGGAPSAEVKVHAKQGYSFTPTVSDPDDDSLTFTAMAPSWATFDPATRTLSGTPTWRDVGTSSTVVISVTDNKSTPVSVSFTIAVPNRAPEIGGKPVTSVAAGSFYSFTPTATDPDGAPLTFYLDSTPGWATFSASTGTISGTPPKGSYSISISVSDGNEKVYLQTFVIDALPPCYPMTALWVPASNSTGTYTVNWQNNMSGVIYILEQSVNGGAYEQIYSGTEPRRIIKVATNGDYSYRVRATKAGYADSAPMVGTAPCKVVLSCTAPLFMRVPLTSLTGGYTVSWDGTPISGVTYELEESTDGEHFTNVYRGTGASATVIRGDGSYYYRVRATKTGYETSGYLTAGNPTVVTIR